MVPYVLTLDNVNLRILETCLDMWHLVVYDNSVLPVIKA